MQDSSGTTVLALDDRDRPGVFAAPKDGRRVFFVRPLVKLGLCGLVLLMVGATFVFSMALRDGFPG